MRTYQFIFSKTQLKKLFFGLVVFFLIPLPSYACTMFTLINSNQALFCNSEDWNSPNDIRIWFVPGNNDQNLPLKDRRYGSVYVGYSNFFAQGGMNTKGLAYDWVAGFREKWKHDPEMEMLIGNPGERMLETCTTTEEAITFFKNNWQPHFTYSKIMIADRSGASAIIGAKNGKVDIKLEKQPRGFGIAKKVVEKMLSVNSEATITNATAILQAAVQKGSHSTKYSNIFDMNTLNIFLLRFPDLSNPIKLNLVEELNKGRHYYDLADIENLSLKKR